jgi:hypothetical protein
VFRGSYTETLVQDRARAEARISASNSLADTLSDDSCCFDSKTGVVDHCESCDVQQSYDYESGYVCPVEEHHHALRQRSTLERASFLRLALDDPALAACDDLLVRWRLLKWSMCVGPSPPLCPALGFCFFGFKLLTKTSK